MCRSWSNVESFLKSRRSVPEVPFRRSCYTVGVPIVPSLVGITSR